VPTKIYATMCGVVVARPNTVDSLKHKTASVSLNSIVSTPSVERSCCAMWMKCWFDDSGYSQI
jgi:hypothetical protein